jgi:LysM repeat protein
MTRDVELLPQPQRIVQAQVLTGTVNFSVLGTDTALPLAGATVSLAGVTQATDAVGNARFLDVPEGAHPYSVSLAGYVQVNGSVTVVAGETLFAIIRLDLETAPAITTYTVQEGDTLTAIAAMFGITLGELLDANPQITDPDVISVGQVINIPGAGEPPPPGPGGTYIVQEGDTLTAIAALFGVTLDELLAVNPDITDPDVISVGQVINIPGAGEPPPGVATGTVRFLVQDGLTAFPLPGATVSFAGVTEASGADGTVAFTAEEGTHPYSVSLAGYVQVNGQTTVIADQTAFQRITLERFSLSPGVFVVAAGVDDGQWGYGTSSTFNTVLNTLPLLHYGSGSIQHWLRFTVPIQRGSTILRAFIRYRMAEGKTAAPVDTRIRADLVDDAPNPTSRGDALNRWRTGTNVRWVDSITAAAGETVDSVDISATIQPVIDLPGWEGKHLALYLIADSPMTSRGVEFVSANSGLSSPPELVVEFTPPPGAPPPPPPPPPAGTTYTVQPGDTLSGIAEAFGVTLDELLAVNPQITNPDLIFVGQVINIPGEAPPPTPGFTTVTVAITDVVTGAPVPATVRFGGFADGSVRDVIADAQGTAVFVDIPLDTELAIGVTATGYVSFAQAQVVFTSTDPQSFAVALVPLGGAPPREPPPCATCTLYVVQPGDTLGEIAAANNVTLDELLAVNPQITDPDVIFVGETINIPSGVVGLGAVRFIVQDAATAAPLAGATVSFVGSTQSTGADGTALFTTLPAGTFPYSVSQAGYTPASGSATVIADQTPVALVLLQREAGTASVRVDVADVAGVAIAGATVTLDGDAVVTGPSGEVTFADLQATVGPHLLTVEHPDFATAQQVVGLVAGETTFVSITLTAVAAGPKTTVTVSVTNAVTAAPVVATVRVGGFADGSFRDVIADELGLAVFVDIPLDRELSIGVTATGYVSFAQAQLIFTSTDPQAFAVALVPLDGAPPPPDGAGGGAGTMLLLGGLAAAALAFTVLRGREQQEA